MSRICRHIKLSNLKFFPRWLCVTRCVRKKMKPKQAVLRKGFTEWSVGELPTACIGSSLHIVIGYCKRASQIYHAVLELLEMKPFCFKACRATRKQAVAHSSKETGNAGSLHHIDTFYPQTRQLTSESNKHNFAGIFAQGSLWRNLQMKILWHF